MESKWFDNIDTEYTCEFTDVKSGKSVLESLFGGKIELNTGEKVRATYMCEIPQEYIHKCQVGMKIEVGVGRTNIAHTGVITAIDGNTMTYVVEN